MDFLKLKTIALAAAIAAIGFIAPSQATPISDKYAALGGASSFLGAATIPESTAPDGVGKYRHYQGGSIYWHPETGAFEVHGLIRQRWAALNWERGYLGYPMTDEIDTFDGAGKVTKFQGGELIWTSANNKVREIKSTHLIIDLPIKVGEVWRIIQANAVPPGGSHKAQWAYAWDLVLANGTTDGRPFVSGADGPVAWVEEGFKVGDGADNRIAIRLGEGRYASYLHFVQRSYSKYHRPGGRVLTFQPQALPWKDRPSFAGGTVLADTSNVCTTSCGPHIHFAVTTKPDIPQFLPFETVPVSFRNYSYQVNCSGKWIYSPTGVPRKGQCVRREASTGTTKAVMTTSVTPIHFGTINGSISLAPGGKPTGSGKLTATVISPWGEPLRSTVVNVRATHTNGPWTYEIKNVPAFDNLKIAATFAGPWSVNTGGGPISGESGSLNLKPNGSSTQNIALKATIIN